MLKKNEDFKEELQNQYTILIKAEAKKQSKRTIVLYILCGITLFMTLISLITVAISLTKTKEEQQEIKASETSYQTLVVNYNNGKLLELNSIGNGYVLPTPKVITVSNEGDTTLKYQIKVMNIETSLLSTNNLVYTLTKNKETSSAKELPLQESYILNDIKLTPGESVTYKIDVKFNGILESGNISNYYKANIVVEQINEQADLLN